MNRKVTTLAERFAVRRFYAQKNIIRPSHNMMRFEAIFGTTLDTLIPVPMENRVSPLSNRRRSALRHRAQCRHGDAIFPFGKDIIEDGRTRPALVVRAGCIHDDNHRRRAICEPLIVKRRRGRQVAKHLTKRRKFLRHARVRRKFFNGAHGFDRGANSNPDTDRCGRLLSAYRSAMTAGFGHRRHFLCAVFLPTDVRGESTGVLRTFGRKAFLKRCEPLPRSEFRFLCHSSDIRQE